MEKLTLQQVAEKKGLQTVTVDGKEYIIGEMKNFFNLAEEHHLRINILMKDDNKQQDWTLLPYYTFDGLCVNHIILNYMNDDYMVIKWQDDYVQCAQRFVNHAIANGATPTEVEEAINDTKAIERMFKDDNLGYKKSLTLVMDKACTEHHIVPSNSDTLVSFKGITLAVALSEPTQEETELAVSLVKAGKSVPCLNGMMPEDIYALHGNTIDGYNFAVYDGDEEEDEEGKKWSGPYIILDDDDCLGYAYRYTWDGIHWFWVEGEHTNRNTMSEDQFIENRYSLEHLLASSENQGFISWMKPQQHKAEKYGTMLQLPTFF